MVGSQAREIVEEQLTDSAQKVFFTNVRNYYVKAHSYMVNKCPLNDGTLSHEQVCDVSGQHKVKVSSRSCR